MLNGYIIIDDSSVPSEERRLSGLSNTHFSWHLGLGPSGPSGPTGARPRGGRKLDAGTEALNISSLWNLKVAKCPKIHVHLGTESTNRL